MSEKETGRVAVDAEYESPRIQLWEWDPVKGEYKKVAKPPKPQN